MSMRGMPFQKLTNVKSVKLYFNITIAKDGSIVIKHSEPFVPSCKIPQQILDGLPTALETGSATV